jgi:hypothetical protein
MKRLSTCCLIAAAFFSFVPASAGAATTAPATSVCGGIPVRYALRLEGSTVAHAAGMSEKDNGTKADSAITVTRIPNASMELSLWRQAVLTGDLAAARKNADIWVYDKSGHQLERISLVMAWPSALVTNKPTVNGAQRLQETIVLTFESEQKTCG